MSHTNLTVGMAITVFIGIFIGSFVDAIAGGGGLITLPTYLITGIPAHIALGTNKFSSTIGTAVSTTRYISKGYADLKLGIPCAFLAVFGAFVGTLLQLKVPDIWLRYILLAVLPVAAFVVLRQRRLSEERGAMDEKKRLAILCATSLVCGTYDGFYGPGAGTFLLLGYCVLAKLDVRTASGNVKIANLASNIGALVTSLINGKVFFALGAVGMCASLLGHWLGSGFAIKKGSKVIRPMVIFVMVILTIKVAYDLFT